MTLMMMVPTDTRTEMEETTSMTVEVMDSMSKSFQCHPKIRLVNFSKVWRDGRLIRYFDYENDETRTFRYTKFR